MPLQAFAQSEHVRTVLSAAESGDAQAQFAAGVIYEMGLNDVAQNFATAAEWYQKAASRDHAGAQAALGYLHQTGKGLPKDPGKAADWYKRSAAAGDISGQFHLAVAYINGIGVTRDARQAAEWMYKAAEADNQQAQLMFATMLQAGTGVKRNEFAARRWFDRAAEGPDSAVAGNARAMRAKIDDRVLFSGSFRPEDVAAVALIGFGLAALMFAAIPEHARTGPDYSYSWQEYQPPQLFTPQFAPSPSSNRRREMVIQYTKPIVTNGRVTGSHTYWERRPIR
jgi:hypothetical protein